MIKKIIEKINSLAEKSNLKNEAPEEIRIRLHALSEIVFAANKARELLEAALDAAEERASTAHQQQEGE